MDHRIALKPGTQLKFSNHHGECLIFFIEREISQGGSNILYDAYRWSANDTKIRYRIKEYYPLKLDVTRSNDQRLIVREVDQLDYEAELESVIADFKKTNTLFYSGSNYARIVNQVDIFKANNTVYTICSYTSEMTLGNYRPLSLKECIHLVKLCAYSLLKIHEQGFLYLDLKPENVLLVEGMNQQVLLCDFDSMLPFDPKCNKVIEPGQFRLSYTKGFAPIEQEMGQIARLGIHSDVFGVGALLFYMIFGRTPSVFDCEFDSVFNYRDLLYSVQYCDDHLLDELSDFLHHTIAIYFADRYQEMGLVIDQLKRLEKYADVSEPRILSSRIVQPKYLFGRQKELERLHELLSDRDTNYLNVYGLGGIGKSSTVRYFLSKYKDEFDTILYLHYRGSLDQTLADETQVMITSINEVSDEFGQSRLNRKKQLLREWFSNRRSIVVIDDFDGTVADLEWIIHTNCVLLVVSRQRIESNIFTPLQTEEIGDVTSLKSLFEANLGRELRNDEHDDFIRIAGQCQWHTLLMELQAKLVVNAHITIHQAAEALSNLSLSNVASEKIVYEKDQTAKKANVSEIIREMFRFTNLSSTKKSILSSMSSSSSIGIEINDLQRLNKLGNKDEINDLIDSGLLGIDGEMVTIHRIVREAIIQDDKNLCCKAASVVGKYYENRLKPLMTCSLKSGKHEPNNVEVGNYNNVEINTRKGKNLLIETALGIVEQMVRYGLLSGQQEHLSLMYRLLMVLPRDRIEAINNLGNEYIRDLKPKCIDDYRELMEVYRTLVIANSNMESGQYLQTWINEAERIAQASHDNYCLALYWDAYGAYQDVLLNGNYDASTMTEVKIRNNMLNAIDRVIDLSKPYIESDRNCLYINNLLSKITIIIRADIKKQLSKIPKLLAQCNDLINRYLEPISIENLNFMLVCGWYYALVVQDKQKTVEMVKAVEALGEKLIDNDACYIDDVMVPCANMLLECGDSKKTLNLLYLAIDRAMHHWDKGIYQNQIRRLCDYYFQTVVHFNESKDKTTMLIDIFDSYIESNEDSKWLWETRDALVKPGSSN